MHYEQTEGTGSIGEPQGVDPGIGGVDPQQMLVAATGFARESPHTALCAALVLGFLLGGGLTPRLLGGILMIAGRRYLMASVRETLTSVIQEQLANASRADEQAAR